MEMTWIAIAASLLMACGAALFFVFAVKRDYFKNLEDAKYQVFWSDLDDPETLNRAGRPAHRAPGDVKNEGKRQTTTK
jgi:hypothetical protein